MNQYFAQHPDMKLFRRREPKFQSLFEELLDGRLATGKFSTGIQSLLESSFSANEKEDEMDLPASYIDSSIQTRSPSQTSSVDQYSIQSQLEQQQRQCSAASTSPSTAVLLRKQSATNSAAGDRFKQSWVNEIANLINGFESQLMESTVMITKSLISVQEQAQRSFLKKINELFPVKWHENGHISFFQYESVLAIFNDESKCATYLALLKQSKKKKFE